jgi:hypothetical protein
MAHSVRAAGKNGRSHDSIDSEEDGDEIHTRTIVPLIRKRHSKNTIVTDRENMKEWNYEACTAGTPVRV